MVNGLFEDKSTNRAEEDAPYLRYYASAQRARCSLSGGGRRGSRFHPTLRRSIRKE